jgi:peptidyl-prolyl cis-trans isomerase SurA
MPYRLLTLIALALLMALPPTMQGRAQEAFRIAATVNDDAITLYEVLARTEFIVASTDLPNNEETKRRLLPQVLRGMVDEKLQLQEAESLNITVRDNEIEGEIIEMVRRSGNEMADFKRFLDGRNIPISVVKDQIRARIAWRKVIARKLRPRIQITEDEINEIIARQKANVGKPEYLLAEIFLPIDEPAQEDQAYRAANRLVEQLDNGASFPALAQQFSRSASARRGGDLGWVLGSTLVPELRQAVQALQPGQYSGPIRTVEGIYIVLNRGQRAYRLPQQAPEKVRLSQIYIPLPKDVSEDEVENQRAFAEEISGSLNNCKELNDLAKEMESTLSGDMGVLETSSLPPDLQDTVSRLDVNEASEPMVRPDGIRVLMVCDREGGGEGFDRQAIVEQIGTERLNRLAQQYIREMRRNAFVDIRI